MNFYVSTMVYDGATNNFCNKKYGSQKKFPCLITGNMDKLQGICGIFTQNDIVFHVKLILPNICAALKGVLLRCCNVAYKITLQRNGLNCKNRNQNDYGRS